MRQVKLTIAYEGTRYHGFQVQRHKSGEQPTIQQQLQQAITQTVGHPVKVVGAGRTDAGVHALGQVVSFRTTSSIPITRFAAALNGCLPEDIVVRKAEEVPQSFHPYLSSRGKLYRYFVDRSKVQLPFCRRYSLSYAYPLDVERMKTAAARFRGEHDFAAFAASGRTTTTSVRRIRSCRVLRRGSFLVVSVSGEGFLYNMVRIMVGTLLEIGRGRFGPEVIDRCFAERKRELAGPTVPPHGLFLVRVYY